MRELLSALVLATLVSSPAHAATPRTALKHEIAAALSAAPPSVAAHAAVIRNTRHGSWVVLRRGSNGWTCESPGGGDPAPRPVCLDANGLAFFRAFDAGRSPDPSKPGLSYMLKGGSAWSNTDPGANKLPAGRADYIHIPPHIMILDSKIANESGLPLHETDPDTHVPFVMFGGTKYAILIIPVK
jgi:hypothetical protein